MSTDIRRMASNLARVDHLGNLKEAGFEALEGGGVGFLLGTIAKHRKGGLSLGGYQADLGVGAAGLLLGPYLAQLPFVGRFVGRHEHKIREYSKIAFGIGVYNQTVRGGGVSLLAHGDAEAQVLAAAKNL